MTKVVRACPTDRVSHAFFGGFAHGPVVHLKGEVSLGFHGLESLSFARKEVSTTFMRDHS